MSGKPLVRFGFFLTAIFLILVVILAMLPHCTKGHGAADCVNNFSRFIASSPNEKGDTLAGIAGSLAFLWIIITVLLQRNELAAQREELQLTREEFSRMADAQTKQVDLLVKQGEIFEEEQRQRKEYQIGEVFRQDLKLLVAQMREYRPSCFVVAPVGKHFSGLKNGYYQNLSNDHLGLFLLPPHSETEVEEQFIGFHEYLIECSRLLSTLLEKGIITQKSKGYEKFLLILETCENLLWRNKLLGDADKRLAARVRLVGICELLNELKTLPVWEETP